MNRVSFSRCYLILTVALLLLSLDFVPVLAATPQNGSYMARFYAPYYYDYIEIDDSFTTETVNSATENVTVQGHVYIQDVSCTGIEEVFDVFQFYYYDSPDTFYQYGASVMVSSDTYTDELKLYVSTPQRPYQPDYDYIRTLSKDTWYNITMVHNDTSVYVYVNDVLNETITGVPDFNLNLNHLRIGESNNQHRELILAYNIYVDYINLDGGGLGSPLTWDFESNFNDFNDQDVSDDSELEIVAATETGILGAEPEESFVITPDEQDGYIYETLTYELECYNDGADAQFTLEIIARYGDDEDTWNWQFEDDSFNLDAGESVTLELYCYIGATGNYSAVLIHMRRVGTSVYYADTAQANSLGTDPSTVTPIGPIPSITGYEYSFFGLFGSLGLGGVFFGAMSRGKEPIVGVIGFLFGLIFFTWVGWIDNWVLITFMAFTALAYSAYIISKLGGR